MFTVERAYGGIDPRQKVVIGRDTLALRQPHIGHVHVLESIIINVHPTGAHPRPVVLHTRLGSDVSEGTVTIAAVQILPTEIVGHIEIGPTVIIVITPSSCEAEAMIILVHATICGHVVKCAVATVAKEKIRRTILCVVIGRRILMMIQSLVIIVDTKINV